MRSPGSIFFSSLAFPKTKGFFWPNVLSVLYFYFSRNFLILYWCKDCKNVIRDTKEISPKQTFLLVFRALQVPSWNIRFLRLELKSSISRNIKTFFFHFSSSERLFLKYKKNMRLESSTCGNIRKFLISELECLISWNIRKFFGGIFIIVIIIIISSLGSKVWLKRTCPITYYWVHNLS